MLARIGMLRWWLWVAAVGIVVDCARDAPERREPWEGWEVPRGSWGGWGSRKAWQDYAWECLAGGIRWERLFGEVVGEL